MRKNPIILSMIALLTFSGAADVFSINPTTADRVWRADGTAAWVGQTTARTGSENTTSQKSFLVMPFRLPVLPDGHTITEASFQVTVSALAVWSDTTIGIDLRGVRTDTDDATLSSDISGGTLLSDDLMILDQSLAAGVKTAADSALATYLQGLYDADAGAAGKYVFLSLGPDAAHAVNQAHYATVYSANNGSDMPQLTLTTTAATSEVDALVDTNDRMWRSDGSAAWVGQTSGRVGSYSAGETAGMVLPFWVPDLDGLQVVDAELSVTLISGGLTYSTGLANADVYGVRSSSSSTTTASDYTGGTLVIDDWFNINSSLVLGEKTVESATLASWIDGEVGTTGGTYVFLTIRPDAVDGTYRYATMGSADASSGIPALKLTLSGSSGTGTDSFDDPDGIFTNVPNVSGSVLNNIRNLEFTTGAQIDKETASTYSVLAGVTGVTDDGEYLVVDDDFVGTSGGWLEGYNLEGRAVRWQKNASCKVRNCFFGEGSDGWISSDGIEFGTTAYLWVDDVQDVEIRNNTFVGESDYRGKRYGILMDHEVSSLEIIGNHFTGIPSDQIIVNGSSVSPTLIESNYFSVHRVWPETRLDWDPDTWYFYGDLVGVPQDTTWPGINSKTGANYVNGGGEKLIVALQAVQGSDLPDGWTEALFNDDWYCPDPHNDGINIRSSSAGTLVDTIYMDFTGVNGPLWVNPNTGVDVPLNDVLINDCVIVNRSAYKGIYWNPRDSTDYNAMAVKDCWFWVENDNYLYSEYPTAVTHTVEGCIDLKTGSAVTLPEGFAAP